MAEHPINVQGPGMTGGTGGVNYQSPQQPFNDGKALKGSVKKDKVPFKKKVINFLFSDKIDSTMSYLAHSILWPNMKELAYKLGNGLLQGFIFGNQGGNGIPPTGGYTNTSYIPGYGTMNYGRPPVNFYNTLSNPLYATPPVSPVMQQRISIWDYSFEGKDDANLVLDRMNNVLGTYGKVRVADFYISAGITGQEDNWTLQGWGWYDLSMATPILRTDGRWMINFPQPVQLH